MLVFLRFAILSVAVILILSSQSLASSPQSSASVCQGQLERGIDTIINRPQFKRFRWGISVKTLSQREPIYSRDAEHYFIPASTIKLMTTAAALTQLPQNYRIRTSVYGDQNGNLYVVGRGDPTLTTTQLEDLAQQLKNQGINQVNQLIADDHYFSGFSVHPNWEWEDVQAGYGTSVNSLILHQNSMDFILTPQQVNQPLKVSWVRPEQGVGWQVQNNTRTVRENEREFVKIGRDFNQPMIYISGQLIVGSEPENLFASVSDPTENFIQEFRKVLEKNGIRVLNTATHSNRQYSSEELAGIDSPPLTELITTAHLQSNNLFAEVLLRTLGAQQPSLDTVESGLTAIKQTLNNLGVSPDSYVLSDGSGLSRHNLASPESLTQTLVGMANSPLFEVYKNSLSVAGETGMLRRRFQETTATRIVYAKTGTLTGVAGLAGYIDPPNFQPLAFSIIVNNANLWASELRQAIDEIVILLSQLKSC